MQNVVGNVGAGSIIKAMMKQIKIPFIRPLILIFLSLQVVIFLSAQTLSKGRYSMLEKMTVGRDIGDNADITYYIPGIYTTIINLNRPNKQWYHKTTLIITDTSFTVKKVPVYITTQRIIIIDSSKKVPVTISKETINYSDSSGGFYDYDVKLYKINDTTINVGGRMTECKYCQYPVTATPLFARVGFVIHFNKENLTVDTNFEKGLLFKKEE